MRKHLDENETKHRSLLDDFSLFGCSNITGRIRVMNRHYRLYIQGLESIERKREMAAHIEHERVDEELRDCAFRPSFLTTRPMNSSVHANTPRLYAKYVERLRKGNAISMLGQKILISTVFVCVRTELERNVNTKDSDETYS